MSSPLADLRPRLEAALTEVTEAETALEQVLQELRGGTRAEKVTISAGVESAFARLRVARAELAALRERIADE